MPKVTYDKDGFTMTESVKLGGKGSPAKIEFDYTIKGTTTHDSRAGYYDKFIVYYGMEAATRSMKESKPVLKKAELIFNSKILALKALGIKPSKTDLKKIEGDSYAAVLDALDKVYGDDFVKKCHVAAETKLKKEGQKYEKGKKSKRKKTAAKVVFTILGGAGAVASGPAGWLTAAGFVWLTKSTVTATKALTGIRDLGRSYQSGVGDMERALDAVEAALTKASKLASQLESKADALEMEYSKELKGLKERHDLLVKNKSKYVVSENQREVVDSKIAPLEKLIESKELEFKPLREYREPIQNLKIAFNKEISKIQHKDVLAKIKSKASDLDDVIKYLGQLDKLAKKV